MEAYHQIALGRQKGMNKITKKKSLITMVIGAILGCFLSLTLMKTVVYLKPFPKEKTLLIQRNIETETKEKTNRLLNRMFENGTYEIFVRVELENITEDMEEILTTPYTIDTTYSKNSDWKETTPARKVTSPKWNTRDETTPGFSSVLPKNRFQRVLQVSDYTIPEETIQKTSKESETTQNLYYKVRRQNKQMPGHRLKSITVSVMVDKTQIAAADITEEALQKILAQNLGFLHQRNEIVRVSSGNLLQKSMTQKLLRFYHHNQLALQVVLGVVAFLGLSYAALVGLKVYRKAKKEAKDAKSSDEQPVAAAPKNKAKEIIDLGRKDSVSVSDALNVWLDEGEKNDDN